MDRVLEIEGIQLVGINNRDLGNVCELVPISMVTDVFFLYTYYPVFCSSNYC